MKKTALMMAGIAAVAMASAANAAVVTVADSSAPWLGFMNVSNRPVDGGAYQFGSPWGVADLNVSFNDAAHRVTFTPNTIGDADPYWYVGGGGSGHAGNKIMDASFYQETTGVYSGTLTFSGTVFSNTLTSAHTAYIFIRDFAADYSSVVTSTVACNVGDFSVSLALVPDAARHVQWGVNLTGVNVWATDVAAFGSVVFGPSVPAPASLALIGLGGLMARRRR